MCVCMRARKERKGKLQSCSSRESALSVQRVSAAATITNCFHIYLRPARLNSNVTVLFNHTAVISSKSSAEELHFGMLSGPWTTPKIRVAVTSTPACTSFRAYASQGSRNRSASQLIIKAGGSPDKILDRRS